MVTSRFGAPLWGLRDNYDDDFWLIGKHVVYFLLVLIELFSIGVRLRRYEQISVQNCLLYTSPSPRD